jgi:hypothetical protein
MKRTTVAAMAILLISTTVHAGKEEREYLKNSLEPAVKKTEDAYKSACGCNLKVTVADSTTKTADDMLHAVQILNSVREGVGSYCSDAGSKKAICKMTSLEVAKASPPTFTFKGSKGTATHDGNAYTSWDMITHELDK